MGLPLTSLPVIDLGRTDYAAAHEVQQKHHAEVLALRDSTPTDRAPTPHSHGRILLVEHDPPVITIRQREGARTHLLATPESLARLGVTIAETDRGGDITYHGPGQLVVYPIIDLNAFGLRLHDYMRLLEGAVIDALAEFGVEGGRDSGATGVWVKPMSDGGFRNEPRPSGRGVPVMSAVGEVPEKICAMGVRIRRWVSLHGLALNVTTNLEHFDLIVPCGLAGRRVTSLQQLLGDACPTMPRVKAVLSRALLARLEHAKSQSSKFRPQIGDSAPTVHIAASFEL